MRTEILRMENVYKQYANTVALNKVCISIYQGEVFALMGKNGSGKSTLAQIASGVELADSGQIFYMEHPINIQSPAAAQKLGISIVHQDPLVVPNLDVAQNIFLGSERTTRMGMLNNAYIHSEARRLLDKIDSDIDEYAIMSRLTLTQWQIVMIARALRSKPMLLILDEVTVSFTYLEYEILADVLRKLRKDNVSTVFISHKVNEVLKLADRVGVLCDGIMVGVFRTKECTENKLITLMTAGRTQLPTARPAKPRTLGDTVLSMKEVSDGEGLHDVSLTLRRGEILGIAGLVGSGRRNLVNILYGMSPIKKGELYIYGKKVIHYNSMSAVKKHIGFMPPERIRQGLFANMDLEYNLTIAAIDKCTKFGMLNYRMRRALAKHIIDKLKITPNNPMLNVRKLSGGNQQKTILGRYLAFKPDILIMYEPTKGIDLASKDEILCDIDALGRGGKSIIFISSEFSELFEVCDRVLIMKRGTIVGEVGKELFSETHILGTIVN